MVQSREQLSTIQQHLRLERRCQGSVEGQPIGNLWSFDDLNCPYIAYKALLEDFDISQYLVGPSIPDFSNPSILTIDVVSSGCCPQDTLRGLQYHLACRLADKYRLDRLTVNQSEVQYVKMIAVQHDLSTILGALDEFAGHRWALTKIHDKMITDAKSELDALVSLSV